MLGTLESGVVVSGKGHSRCFGYRTANVRLDLNAPRRCGVFVVAVRLEKQEWRKGFANFGTTYDKTYEGPPHVEIHILYYEGNLYGSTLEFQLCKQLDSLKRCKSFEEAKGELARVAEQTRATKFPVQLGLHTAPQ
jgi:riboflavin kinase/FMN adenylyltransferase